MKLIGLDIKLSDLEQFLMDKGWIDWSTESVEKVEKPGDGNMNVVIRVQTSQRSFILKQSRPFVQKYQDIPAPLERIEVEYQFYKKVQDDAIRDSFPKLIHYDQTNHLIMMEDIGNCDDMSSIYTRRSISEQTLYLLIDILSNVHAQNVNETYPDNIVLRELNHQHIFHLPFLNDNGFDLDNIQPGLQKLSLPYKGHLKLIEKVEVVGKRYLSPGNTLLHGDYYPGSWMNTGDRLYVLDPEFSFRGFAEFDVGVMIGHVLIATSEQSYISKIVDGYRGILDLSLVKRVAGIEIMRRIIGLAQLPLNHSIDEKRKLLQIAENLILQ